MKNITLFFLCLLISLGLSSSAMAQIPQPLPQVEYLQGQNYLFSWEGVPGRVYFIQTSSQLTASEFDWQFAPDIRVGTGSQIEMGFQANADHFDFFRLVYTDYSGGTDPNLANFDNDGYTNLEKAIANTNPYDAQSYPGSGGNTGGGSNENATTWNHPWEYRLTYTFDGYVDEDLINPYNSVGCYSYAMGKEIVTELSFEDVVEVNQVKFLQIEPNLDHDSSDPDSEEWNVIGLVELSAENPNWSDEAPVGTMPEGFLLPVEGAPEVLAVNSDFDEGRIDPSTGYAIPDCDDVPGVDPKTGSGNGELRIDTEREHLNKIWRNGVRRNGVRVQILTKCLSNLRFPSITEKSLHFRRQLGLRFPPIEPAELLAHVRCAAHR